MNDRKMPNDGAHGRKALGDLTNIHGKRGLHLVPGKFIIGNGIGVVESHPEKRVLYSGSKKRVRRGPESLFNEAENITSVCSNTLNEEQKSWKTWMFSENKDGPKISSLECHGLRPSSSRFKHQQENKKENERTSSMKLPKKLITLGGALNPGLHCIRGKALNHNFTADRLFGIDCGSDLSGHMECGKAHSAPISMVGFKENLSVPSIDKDDGISCAACPLESSGLGFVKFNRDITQDSKIYTADLLNNCCTQDSSDVRTTSIDKSFDFVHIANMASSSMSGVIHGNKSCSCNFCLKASYIWADLLSQDVRGRLAELGKSLRLAKALAEKDYFHDFTRGCSERSLKYSRMDFDLAQRWKSLFVSTENALHCEGAQMQASLVKIKELTANCKRDLETISALPPNLPEASDGSD